LSTKKNWNDALPINATARASVVVKVVTKVARAAKREAAKVAAVVVAVVAVAMERAKRKDTVVMVKAKVKEEAMLDLKKLV
jgi:hypothetical protein